MKCPNRRDWIPMSYVLLSVVQPGNETELENLFTRFYSDTCLSGPRAQDVPKKTQGCVVL